MLAMPAKKGDSVDELLDDSAAETKYVTAKRSDQIRLISESCITFKPILHIVNFSKLNCKARRPWLTMPISNQNNLILTYTRPLEATYIQEKFIGMYYGCIREHFGHF
jgi:hypothetical protein